MPRIQHPQTGEPITSLEVFDRTASELAELYPPPQAPDSIEQPPTDSQRLVARVAEIAARYMASERQRELGQLSLMDSVSAPESAAAGQGLYGPTGPRQDQRPETSVTRGYGKRSRGQVVRGNLRKTFPLRELPGRGRSNSGRFASYADELDKR